MKEFYLKSNVDGKEFYCVDFTENVKNPNFILQICHGMAEHITRYSDFASFLERQGVKVFGMDNRGHGNTAESFDELGNFADEKGNELVVEDVFQLNQYIKGLYPDKKIFLLGHSMGSLITRNFLNKHSYYVDGAIICGTTGLVNFKYKMSGVFSKIICGIFGKRRKMEFVNNLAFNDYNSRIDNNRTKFDWLTRDEKVVENYILDKDCGFLCTNKFFVDSYELIKNSSDKNLISKINKTLPILFISGKEDPVGDYGKGVLQSYKLYKESGLKKAKLKLYDGMRHEILNEIGREEVYADMFDFLNHVNLDKA